MPDRGIVLDEATWRRLRAAIQWVESQIRLPPAASPAAPGPQGFWAKITAAEELESGRHEYEFEQARKAADDPGADGAWTALQGGISGTAYNRVECVAVALPPCPVGAVVWIESVRLDEDPWFEFWFSDWPRLPVGTATYQDLTWDDETETWGADWDRFHA